MIHDITYTRVLRGHEYVLVRCTPKNTCGVSGETSYAMPYHNIIHIFGSYPELAYSCGCPSSLQDHPFAMAYLDPVNNIVSYNCEHSTTYLNTTFKTNIYEKQHYLPCGCVATVEGHCPDACREFNPLAYTDEYFNRITPAVTPTTNNEYSSKIIVAGCIIGRLSTYVK